MVDTYVTSAIATPAPHLELIYKELSLANQNLNVNNYSKYALHRINFGEISSNFGAAGYGFGVERLDFSRNSRKTIQQTKGNIDGTGKLDPGSNFFVDVWWMSPPRVVLAGVAEMPAAKDLPICYWNDNNIDSTNIRKRMFSFLDAMDIFFEFNNNPTKVKNDELWLIDYMKKQHLKVTLKDFVTNVSVDRPNLITFQITMEVLHEIHTDFIVPYQKPNTTTPTTVGNFTLPDVSLDLSDIVTQKLNASPSTPDSLSRLGNTDPDTMRLRQ